MLPVSRRDMAGPGRAVRSIEVVESTGSTNADLLARHAAGNDINGAVLIAEHQSAGRGRQGRCRWFTPPIGHRPVDGIDAGGQAPSAWGWLPLLTGVAVADAVAATTGIEPAWWPNDIMVGAGKLGASSPRWRRRPR